MSVGQIIDADAHVVEVADLWASRLPRKWVDRAPRVEIGPTDLPWWRFGEHWLHPVGLYAHGGWKDYYPSVPATLDEADPATWDPAARLERMDAFGIVAQVLYPNLLAFEVFALLEQADADFQLACIQASNDFLADFASVDNDRLLPIALLPFWDLDATIAEMVRCRDRGHRGVAFAMALDKVGLPHGTDPYWDPLYSAAQDLGLSINYHIGFSTKTREEFDARSGNQEASRRPNNTAKRTALIWLSNANTIAELTMGGVCHRFPDLKFVSVESGFGYIPFLLSGMDWMWKNARDSRSEAYRDWLLPSEFFLRQVYCTYWFEQSTLKLLEDYQDNVMFETDFPHPTSLTPGPGCIIEATPDAFARENLRAARVPERVQQKVLYENAAKLYGVLSTDPNRAGRTPNQVVPAT